MVDIDCVRDKAGSSNSSPNPNPIPKPRPPVLGSPDKRYALLLQQLHHDSRPKPRTISLMSSNDYEKQFHVQPGQRKTRMHRETAWGDGLLTRDVFAEHAKTPLSSRGGGRGPSGWLGYPAASASPSFPCRLVGCSLCSLVWRSIVAVLSSVVPPSELFCRES